MNQNKIRLFGVFLAAMAVATLCLGAYFQIQQRQAEECQANFNRHFIQQLRDRAEITKKDREALATLIQKVINADSREDSRSALKRYLKQKEKYDAERSESPLPKLPKPESC